MAKHLSGHDVGSVIDIIDAWAGEKLTWEALCDACADAVGKRPTRQSLQSHQPVKTAYNAKKAMLKTQVPRQPLPANLKAAAERIKNLESKVQRLEYENRALLERFVVWQYNAYKHGMTEQKLNESLPVIDRDRTDGARPSARKAKR